MSLSTPSAAAATLAGRGVAAPWAVEGNRRNNFDFLRFVLATLVVWSHCYHVVHTTLPEPLNWLSREQMLLGSFAVNCFFLISGFLVTGSWEKSRGLGDFLRKRALRIYPGFVVACLLCAFVVGPLGAQNVSVYFKAFDLPEFVLRLGLLRTLKVPPTLSGNVVDGVNVSLWTIVFEFACYLLVAGCGLLGLLRRPRVVLGAFVASLTLFTLKPLPGPGALFDLHRLSIYFLAGMCFYLFRERIPLSRRWLTISLLGFFGTLLAGKGFAAAQAVFGAYLLFWLAYRPMGLERFGARGDLSYGVYLYGFPIQQLLVHFGGTQQHPLAVFALTMPGLLAAAAASWFLVERPFLRLKTRSRTPA